MSSGPVVLVVDPRTRRIIQRLLAAIIGFFFLLIALRYAGLVPHPGRPPLPPPDTNLLLLVLVMVVILALGIVSLQRGRVVLEPTGLVVTRGLGPARTVARADIVAWRSHPEGWRRAPYYELFLHDGRRVKLPSYLRATGALREFLADIPQRH